MLISTVCKMHGLSRIRGPNSVFIPLFSLHFRPCITHGLTILSSRRVDSRGLLDPRIGRTRIDRWIVLIFTRTERISRPTLRSRSAGRSLESVVSSDFHCVASGRAPVSLTMACVLNWSPCVSRRHQAVYCIQISLGFIITI